MDWVCNLADAMPVKHLCRIICMTLKKDGATLNEISSLPRSRDAPRARQIHGLDIVNLSLASLNNFFHMSLFFSNFSLSRPFRNEKTTAVDHAVDCHNTRSRAAQIVSPLLNHHYLHLFELQSYNNSLTMKEYSP